jgi:hypothetical protein
MIGNITITKTIPMIESMMRRNVLRADRACFSKGLSFCAVAQMSHHIDWKSKMKSNFIGDQCTNTLSGLSVCL